ncbi:MAG: hypothetical protein J3K34DRAFT_472790 [Monoraphidium minutum]|nr:MAG: hypothetical protein J3K34DRAFT_472790 [Monoraphidium minutum]
MAGGGYATPSQCASCLLKAKSWQPAGLCTAPPLLGPKAAAPPPTMPDYYTCLAASPSQAATSYCPACLLAGGAQPGRACSGDARAQGRGVPGRTDVLYDLLRAGGGHQLARQPVWARPGLGDGGGGSGSGGGGGAGDAALLAEFRRECRVVRQAMQGDLVKALGSGLVWGI